MGSTSEPNLKDIVILVMGATGAGKSTFINAAAEREAVKVGKSLVSCTTDVSSVSIPLRRSIASHWDLKNLDCYKLVMVDTPGFDDTFEEDVEILRRIAEWLKNSYNKQPLFAGVIYLHDVSINRFTGTARRNLEMFQALCGTKVLDKVILGTTMWDKAVGGAGERNEIELRDSHWAKLRSDGAKTLRFPGGHEAAQKFIDSLLSLLADRLKRGSEEEYLQIQVELVRKHKIIPETKAARQLSNALQQALNKQKQLTDLQRSLADRDEDVHKQLTETEKKIERLRLQVMQLKIPWLRKIFGLFRS